MSTNEDEYITKRNNITISFCPDCKEKTIHTIAVEVDSISMIKKCKMRCEICGKTKATKEGLEI